MKLNVFRGGKLIYHADADKSLVDLLTKRFNPRRSYSMNAVKIFNDLNLLANLPRHPSSGKSKTFLDPEWFITTTQMSWQKE